MAVTIRKSGMKQVPLSEIKDGWAIFELTLRAPRRIVSFIRYERPQVASSRHLRSGAPDARKRPMRSLRLAQTAPKAPAGIQRHSRMTFGTFANGQRGAQFVHPNRPFQLNFNGKMPWTQRQLNLTP